MAGIGEVGGEKKEENYITIILVYEILKKHKNFKLKKKL